MRKWLLFFITVILLCIFHAIVWTQETGAGCGYHSSLRSSEGISEP
ncbi:hypothetical protein ACFL6S_25900 [Candidatus Poribacteria bacterium]